MTLPLHARPGHVTSDPALSLPGRGAPSPACAASSQVQAGAFRLRVLDLFSGIGGLW